MLLRLFQSHTESQISGNTRSFNKIYVTTLWEASACSWECGVATGSPRLCFLLSMESGFLLRPRGVGSHRLVRPFLQDFLRSFACIVTQTGIHGHVFIICPWVFIRISCVWKGSSFDPLWWIYYPWSQAEPGVTGVPNAQSLDFHLKKLVKKRTN